MRLHPAILAFAFLLPLAAAAQAPSQTSPPPPTEEQIKAAAAMPFRDPSLPIDKRVDDLVGRLTLEEKVSQLIDRAAPIPRLDIPAYNWWNEGLHGIARSGFATMFPQAIGNAATWDAPLVHAIGEVVSTEARAKYNDAIAPQQSRPLLRPHHLVAQHQHLSRSPLGTRPGNLRRRSLPHRSPRHRLRRRHSGRRSEILPRHRHPQALRRPQRT